VAQEYPALASGTYATILRAHENAITDLHENFWVTSEQDIREMLQKTEQKTEQKIGRVMGALDKAA
jgi:hypothetical protein